MTTRRCQADMSGKAWLGEVENTMGHAKELLIRPVLWGGQHRLTAAWACACARPTLCSRLWLCSCSNCCRVVLTASLSISQCRDTDLSASCALFNSASRPASLACMGTTLQLLPRPCIGQSKPISSMQFFDEGEERVLRSLANYIKIMPGPPPGVDYQVQTHMLCA